MKILRGDARLILPTLEAKSVHCVVTSPPYWGLRDYGTATWDGGDDECDHKESRAFVNPKNTLGPNGYLPETNAANQMHQRQFREICGKCGAHRIDSQLGLEPTPDAYVASMVAVFREVRRVLRDDGTLWLNLGDSYATQGGRGEARMVELGRPSEKALTPSEARGSASGCKIAAGLKPKDLVGIPWRVAFALQADDWWLRQDIIWSKPNPMPESVADRCTKAHEYIFLLSKSARYYYDTEAIAEDAINAGRVVGYDGSQKNCETADDPRFATRITSDRQVGLTRNKRSVWEVATAPFSEAHFATFPPALIEPCILAGCPKQCCTKCGAPLQRKIEKSINWPDHRHGRGGNQDRNDGGMACNADRQVTTLDFSPTCLCNADTVPGTVLDPFGGAGTTGLVADRLQRNAILIELNHDYADMARTRIIDDAPLFATVECDP